jgi:hypothetical protein
MAAAIAPAMMISFFSAVHILGIDDADIPAFVRRNFNPLAAPLLGKRFDTNISCNWPKLQ